MTATRLGRRSRPASRGGALIWLLCLCDAGLLIASGLVHLHLWDIAYRHVPTLDVLFLVQTGAALVAAVLLLSMRSLLLALGSAALMAGTIVGFVLARTSGIFGFHLAFSSGLAYAALIIEAVAVVFLLVTAAVMTRG
jgi:hypothetical protein